MIEVLDHTADIGLRITATSLEGLFIEAAEGMVGLVCSPGATSADGMAEPPQSLAIPRPAAGDQADSSPNAANRMVKVVELDVPASDALPAIPDRASACAATAEEASPQRLPEVWEDLFHDWLAQVLYLFAAERLVPVGYELRFDASGLHACLQVRPYDPAFDGGEIEIKAVTYHGLKIERVGGAFVAEVIFDT